MMKEHPEKDFSELKREMISHGYDPEVKVQRFWSQERNLESTFGTNPNSSTDFVSSPARRFAHDRRPAHLSRRSRSPLACALGRARHTPHERSAATFPIPAFPSRSAQSATDRAVWPADESGHCHRAMPVRGHSCGWAE